ncbi:PepSY domain-containing protein [Bacillus sp. FJAT-49736]|uniref:PepSY domain-containing protein n=1 Tax=Bacillus sp. FJAT-49736 TaxID=2833582 RepID=UPI001BC8DCE2|nr:PepSY domain-containing protein [Bacillus sp. FJAT-49736]MBS4173860.1 PepSY domain-containing protein [Bacillus sp. FJAT-49736]
MTWKSFISGLAIGAISGYLLNEAVKKNTTLSSETVLANVKKAFKEEGPIDGSWIQMTKEDFARYAVKTKIYRGGITTNQNGERKQFEFIADAYTGSVLDVYPIS